MTAIASTDYLIIELITQSDFDPNFIKLFDNFPNVEKDYDPIANDIFDYTDGPAMA